MPAAVTVVEVLVSSLRPFELLAGKVVGVGGVGLFQLAIWALVARVLIGQQAFFLDLFNIDLGGEVLRLPEIPADTIAVLLTYFVLGFLLYATMFAIPSPGDPVGANQIVELFQLDGGAPMALAGLKFPGSGDGIRFLAAESAKVLS